MERTSILSLVDYPPESPRRVHVGNPRGVECFSNPLKIPGESPDFREFLKIFLNLKFFVKSNGGFLEYITHTQKLPLKSPGIPQELPRESLVPS